MTEKAPYALSCTSNGNGAPYISGLLDITDPVLDNARDIFPFRNVTVIDTDGDGNVTVTIELDLPEKGRLEDYPDGTDIDVPNGRYAFDGSPSEVTDHIRAISLVPKENEIPIGSTAILTLTVTVDDGKDSSSGSMEVPIEPFNDPPMFTNSPDGFYLLYEDNSGPEVPALEFDADARDPDNPLEGLRFSISIDHDGQTFDESDLPTWLDFDIVTGRLSGTPRDGDDGIYSVRMSVTDGTNTVHQDDFAIFVHAVNSIPVFTVPEDQTVGVNTTDILQITGIGVGANDPNQEIKEVIVTSDDQGLVPNSKLGTDFDLGDPNRTTIGLYYSTEEGQSGSVGISITLRDDGTVNNSTTKSFTIRVEDINTAPFVPDLSAGFDREEDVNRPIEITGITAGDIGQEVVSASVVSLDRDIVTDPWVDLSGPDGENGQKVTIYYDLVENAFGTARLSLRLEDNGSTLSGTNFKEVVLEVRVAPVDDAPVILGQRTVLSIDEGQPFSLGLEDFDIAHPENENERLTLNILPGTGYAIDGAGLIVPDPGFDGTLRVNVTVSDEGDDEGNQVLTSEVATYSVKINDLNTAPEIVGQVPDTLSVREDGSIVLTRSYLVIRDDSPSEDISISEVRMRAGGNYTVNGTEVVPDADFNGIISVPVVVSDGEKTSMPYDVVIRVLPVNDAPRIVGQFDIGIREEGSYTINIGDLIIVDVDNVLADFTLSVLEGSDYTVVGNMITPEDDFFGPLTVPVIVNDGSANSDRFYMVIDVLPVNDPPTIDPIDDLMVGDDRGRTVFVDFKGVTAGPGETGQDLTVTASSGNRSLIPGVEVIYTPGQSIGLLRMETVPKRNGTATITVTVKDDGGTENGGNDTKVIAFDVKVIGVNSAPTLGFISDINLLEDFPPSPVRLRNIRDGDDGTQELTITATSSDPALIPDPVINYVQGETEGTLTFVQTPDLNGSATITVTVKDDGGTANGGEDTYRVTFEINILPVNDPPTIDAVQDTSILEDSERSVVRLTGITDGDAEEEQRITITAKSSRPEILEDPKVLYDPLSTTADLVLVPVADMSGISTVTVTVRDDGGSLIDGQQDTRSVTFKVRVVPVNDAPTIDGVDTPIRILEGSGAHRLLLTGITDGDPDQVQIITSVTVGTYRPGLYERLEISYREGDTNGELILKTAPHVNGMDTLTITVKDNGGTENGGIDNDSIDVIVDILPLNGPPNISNPPSIDNVLKNSEGGCITLSGIDDGDPELEQEVTITATSSRPDIVPHPVISGFDPSEGVASLCYAPLPDARGLVEITVTLRDDGGLPGNDTRSVTFTIGVGMVNNPPMVIGMDGLPLEELVLTTQKDVPLDICLQVIDRDRDEVALGQVMARNPDASGGIVPGSFSFKDDSLCFVYEAYPDILSGEDWFEVTICDDVPEDMACDTIRMTIGILPSSRLVIYDGISPTRPDGMNDAWFIEGIENYPDNVVQIYSTGGELVFEEVGYDNVKRLWRGGTNTGIALGNRGLPSGVYYYVIVLGDGVSPPLKGSVIIR